MLNIQDNRAPWSVEVISADTHTFNFSVHTGRCQIKVTACNNLPLLKYAFIGSYFWYHLQIHLDGICSCEGLKNTPVIPPSHPGYAPVVVLWFGSGHPVKMQEKLLQHDIVSYIAQKTSVQHASKLLSVLPVLLLVLF